LYIHYVDVKYERPGYLTGPFSIADSIIRD
jgi:hypothetical protein